MAKELVGGEAEEIATPSSGAAQEIAKKLQTIQSCSNQIWPDLKLGQYPMYVADYNGGTQMNSLYEIDVTKGQTKSPAPDVTSHIRKASYSPYFTDVPSGGKTGVAVSIGGPGPGGRSSSKAPKPTEKSPMPAKAPPKKEAPFCATEDEAYSAIVSSQSPARVGEVEGAINLLTHEAFHNVDQNSEHACNGGYTPWSDLSPRGNALRSLEGVLPNESENDKMMSQSLEFRSAMIYNLRKALETPSRRNWYLAEASRWYRKWEQQQGLAVTKLREVDRLEGVASYVGSMSAAVGEAGCGDSQQRRQAFIKNAGSKMISTPAPLDTQAYGLGAGAGAMLDALGDTSWKQKVMQGKTPMEILASQFPEKPPVSPQAIPGIVNAQKKYDSLYRCQRQETLKSVKEAHSNPAEYVAIAIPIESTLRHPAAPFSLNGDPWQLASYSSVSLGFEMQNWPQARSESNACGTGKYSIILIPKDQVSAGAFKSTSIAGSASGQVGAAAGKYNAFDLYCAQ